jgi:SAM-dependent methyltransferase
VSEFDDTTAPYDGWAKYYDLTDADRGPFIDFYSGLLTPAMNSVLELGCGTGTIGLSLADARRRDGARTPLRLVGLDQSQRMIQVARGRGRDHQWLVGDIRRPPVVGPFDLVICCFNTLQHLLDDDDLAQAFTAVHGLLAADGVFAFDIYQPNAAYLATPHTNRMARAVTDSRGHNLEIRENTRYDDASRVLTIEWTLVQCDPAVAEPLARTRYHLRQYSAGEVERALARSGLVIEQRFGDFDRSPLTPASRKQLVVCRSTTARRSPDSGL